MVEAEPQPVARLWLKGEDMAQGQGYTVKSIEPVAIGSDVQARLFTLAPGETIPWHFHSAVTDWYFVLKGTLSIETRAPAERRELAIGETYHIAPKTVHLISNRSVADTRFLLVQGVGAYDFLKVGG
jgi:quercetin dioxygenase-like cupin family protein